MVPEVLEKARVMELQVRMDCNGCVQKIKKAMHNIDGVYDVYIDFPQQKLTVVGRADPEKILKAIKKTRKIATICSHTEPPAEPAPPNPENEPSPAEAAPPPAESEPPKETPAAPAEEKKEEVKPSAEAEATSAEPKDVEEVHMVHYYPQNGPYYVSHGYNSTYRAPVYVSGYGLGRPVGRDFIRVMSGSEAYAAADDHYYYARNYHSGDHGNNITSVFSDENPNACAIV
ncbi:Copper chaperone domain-containing protein [Dioscorea alata]|uniref:Copper chaperone domain-containing protein n=1 Tax=Dioscorea alata TaxID=55571 RepID=A0ACB7VPR1_DIOAL|nr:Copper chaperone domain-containing protein [Dioscorea alata]